MKLLTVFSNTADAEIVRGMLAENGIPSMIRDNDFLYTLQLPEVRILVNDADYDQALRLLHSHNDPA